MTKLHSKIIIEDIRITIVHNDGTKEIFFKDKPNYSKGSQWIMFDEEKYFLKQD
jgi:hypothetical protein